MTRPKVPLWVKAVQWTDRAAWYAFRAEEVARDELLRAWLAPDFHEAVITNRYATLREYLPGGRTFERGLFEWEEEALSKAPFPKSGRFLIGAAGGGREMGVLLSRNFEVVAFEPNPVLRKGAESVAAARTGARVIDATYNDLVEAANHGTGPLADVPKTHFDAVILGWGSITHVLTREEHRALLKALRRAVPNAPVLLSFYQRATNTVEGKSERLRKGLRSVFRALGAHTPSEGLSYDMTNGFVYSFTEEEIHALAFEAGYEVVSMKAWAFPHAVLAPLT